MKLMVCICQNKYVNEVIQTLNQNGLRSTKLASTGGFLKKGNTTILIGISNEGKENVMNLMKEACNREDQKRSTSIKEQQKQGRITIFVVDAHSDKLQIQS